MLAHHAYAVTQSKIESEQPLAVLVSMERIVCAEAVRGCEAGSDCELMHVEDCTEVDVSGDTTRPSLKHKPDHAPA